MVEAYFTKPSKQVPPIPYISRASEQITGTHQQELELGMNALLPGSLPTRSKYNPQSVQKHPTSERSAEPTSKLFYHLKDRKRRSPPQPSFKNDDIATHRSGEYASSAFSRSKATSLSQRIPPPWQSEEISLDNLLPTNTALPYNQVPPKLETPSALSGAKSVPRTLDTPIKGITARDEFAEWVPEGSYVPSHYVSIDNQAGPLRHADWPRGPDQKQKTFIGENFRWNRKNNCWLLKNGGPIVLQTNLFDALMCFLRSAIQKGSEKILWPYLQDKTAGIRFQDLRMAIRLWKQYQLGELRLDDNCLWRGYAKAIIDEAWFSSDHSPGYDSMENFLVLDEGFSSADSSQYTSEISSIVQETPPARRTRSKLSSSKPSISPDDSVREQSEDSDAYVFRRFPGKRSDALRIGRSTLRDTSVWMSVSERIGSEVGQLDPTFLDDDGSIYGQNAQNYLRWIPSLDPEGWYQPRVSRLTSIQAHRRYIYELIRSNRDKSSSNQEKGPAAETKKRRRNSKQGRYVAMEDHDEEIADLFDPGREKKRAVNRVNLIQQKAAALTDAHVSGSPSSDLELVHTLPERVTKVSTSDKPLHSNNIRSQDAGGYSGREPPLEPQLRKYSEKTALEPTSSRSTHESSPDSVGQPLRAPPASRIPSPYSSTTAEPLPFHVRHDTRLRMQADNKPDSGFANVRLLQCDTLEVLFRTLGERLKLPSHIAKKLYGVSAKYMWNGRVDQIWRDCPSDWDFFLEEIERAWTAWEKNNDFFPKGRCEIEILAHMEDCYERMSVEL